METLNYSSSFHQINKLIAKLCIFTWHNLSRCMMVFDVHSEPINKWQFIGFFLAVTSILHLVQWNNRCQRLSHGTWATSHGLHRQGFLGRTSSSICWWAQLCSLLPLLFINRGLLLLFLFLSISTLTSAHPRVRSVQGALRKPAQ